MYNSNPRAHMAFSGARAYRRPMKKSCANARDALRVIPATFPLNHAMRKLATVDLVQKSVSNVSNRRLPAFFHSKTNANCVLIKISGSSRIANCLVTANPRQNKARNVPDRRLPAPPTPILIRKGSQRGKGAMYGKRGSTLLRPQNDGRWPKAALP